MLVPRAGNAGALRTEIRHKYDIRRGLIPDWMVHTICCPCGWCQEAKEMQVSALLACILPGSADWGASASWLLVNLSEAKYFLNCSCFAVIAAHGAVLSSSADHCVLGADRVCQQLSPHAHSDVKSECCLFVTHRLHMQTRMVSPAKLLVSLHHMLSGNAGAACGFIHPTP